MREFSRSTVSWILEVMRVKMGEDSLEGSDDGERDPKVVVLSGPEAAYSISLKLIKSSFVRNGVIII